MQKCIGQEGDELRVENIRSDARSERDTDTDDKHVPTEIHGDQIHWQPTDSLADWASSYCLFASMYANENRKKRNKTRMKTLSNGYREATRPTDLESP